MSSVLLQAGRLPPLDRLRGIAIVAVLLHHSAIFQAMPGLAGTLYTAYGEFTAHGVDVFFALSAFLLVRQLPEAPAAGWMRGFWIRRGAKILPLYLLTLITALVLVPAAATLFSNPVRAVSFTEGANQWPWHLCFATNWLFFNANSFTHPLLNAVWSLSIEVQFYLLLTAAAAFTQARSPRFWLGLTGIAIFTRILAVELDWGWIRIYNFTPSRLDAFAAGALVALRPAWFTRPVCLLGLTVFFAPALLGWDRQESWVQVIGYTWVALATASLIRLSLEKPVVMPAKRSPLAFMGLISYAIYLTHLPIRSLVRDVAFSAPRELAAGRDWARWLTYTGVVFSVVTLVGWLTWRYLESPAQRYLHARFLARAPASPPSQPA